MEAAARGVRAPWPPEPGTQKRIRWSLKAGTPEVKLFPIFTADKCTLLRTPGLAYEPETYRWVGGCQVVIGTGNDDNSATNNIYVPGSELRT